MNGCCFCAAVSYTITAQPVLSAYCHCTQCQRLTGCPFVHTVHFDASAFEWSHPEPHESHLDKFVNPLRPHKTRFRCKTCGATVASYNEKTDRWSIWGAQLERDADGNIKDQEKVKPTAHIFYTTRMLNVEDDLGKWEGYEGRSTRIA